jgi:hypothetical protein
MTRSIDAHRLPGATLLKLAPLLFNEPFVSAVVRPTIADLQSEFLAAGSSRGKRLRARCRGYLAFWAILIAAPFASWTASTETARGYRLAKGRLALALIAATLVVFAPALGVWIAGAVVIGAPVAMVIHAWNARHPSDVPSPSDPPWRSPQINFSSTEIAGNVGGLIFVLGSVLVVSLGLPSVFWFLVAAAIAACFLAWALVAWHTRHPKWGLPESPISLR